MAQQWGRDVGKKASRTAFSIAPDLSCRSSSRSPLSITFVMFSCITSITSSTWFWTLERSKGSMRSRSKHHQLHCSTSPCSESPRLMGSGSSPTKIEGDNSGGRLMGCQESQRHGIAWGGSLAIPGRASEHKGLKESMGKSAEAGHPL